MLLDSSSTEDNPCTSLKCAPNRDCSIDHMGFARCVCPMPCQQTMQLVCGSDGITYDNSCELKRQTCLLNTYATLLHHGPCGRHHSHVFTLHYVITLWENRGNQGMLSISRKYIAVQNE